MNNLISRARISLLALVFLSFSTFPLTLRAQTPQSCDLSGMEGLPSYSKSIQVGGTLGGVTAYVQLGFTLGGTLAKVNLDGQAELSGSGVNRNLSFVGSSGSGTASMNIGFTPIAKYSIEISWLSSTPATGNIPILSSALDASLRDNETFTPYLLGSSVTLKSSLDPISIVNVDMPIPYVEVVGLDLGLEVAPGIENELQGDHLSTDLGTFYSANSSIPVNADGSSVTVSGISESIKSTISLLLTPIGTIGVSLADIEIFSWPVVQHQFSFDLTSVNFSATSTQNIVFNLPMPSAPAAVYPGSMNSPGPVLTTLTPEFSWNAASGATGYGLYIRDLSAPGQPIVYPNASAITNTPLTGTSFHLPGGYLVPGHRYRWNMTSFRGSTEGSVASNRLYFQTEIQEFDISTSSNPSSGGNTSGGGNYASGSEATLTATPNNGYEFLDWTDNGSEVSSNRTYAFTVSSARDLVAYFSPISYTVGTSSSPSNGGTTGGGRAYSYGTTATVTATPNSGFKFVDWTSNGSEMSTSASYRFTVTGSINLVANFSQLQRYTVSVSAGPPAGGSVFGGGTDQGGSQVTVSAVPNIGWSFVDWTEGGSKVSTNLKYTFTVENNLSLVANFLENFQPPTARTLAVNDVADDSAQLDASLTPNSGNSMYYFEWGTTSAYGRKSNNTGPASGSTPETLKYSVGGLLPGTTYHCQFVAWNGTDTSYGGDITFTTLPSSPTQLSPDNGATDVTLNPQLAWHLSHGADSYSIELSTDSLFESDTVEHDHITDTSYVLDGLATDSTYYWRVVATNESGTGKWSGRWHFTTMPGYVSQTIRLPKGWSMVSAYVIPRIENLDTLLDSIRTHLVIIKDGQGNVYWPAYGIQQIQRWNYRYGYQIYMSAPDSLVVTGAVVPQDSGSIELSHGWNLVAYLKDSSTTPGTAFSSIGDTLVIAKDGEGNVYWPSFGIDMMDSVLPGHGYQLYVENNCSLNYPVSFSAGGAKFPSSASPVLSTESVMSPIHYVPSCVNTGSDATMLVEANGLGDGDEVGVWASGDNLVGSGVVSNGRALITIWGDNPMSNVKGGAEQGEKLGLTMWSRSTNQEIPVSVVSVTDALTGQALSNTLKYNTDEVLIVRIAKVKLPGDYVLEQNYPNPFNPTTVIKYGLPKETYVTLAIYDAIGQRVMLLVHQEESAGYHEVTFDGSDLSSGIYFYKLTAGSFDKVDKMILIK